MAMQMAKVWDNTHVLVDGRTATSREPVMRAKHGVKVQCPECGHWCKGSSVDELGWLDCILCGTNNQVLDFTDRP